MGKGYWKDGNYYFGPSQEDMQQEFSSNIPDDTLSYYENLFSGTDYEDLYRSILAKYQSADVPVSLLGYLNGKNQENRYNHDMAFLAELDNLANKVYDEEYQSPLQEVLRNSEAGLNSDLLGLSGQAAANPQSSVSTPAVSASNPLEFLSQTLNTVMSVYSTLKSFKGINLANESKDLSNISQMMQMARPMIIDNVAKGLLPGSEGMSNWTDVVQVYNPFKGDRRKSARFAKAFQMELSSGNYAAAEAAYKRLAGLEDSRSAYGTHVGNSNWSPDDRALFHYVGGMAEMALGRQFEENKFSRKYHEKLSPDAKASFENQDYDSKKFLSRIRNKMNRQLEYDYNNGSILAGLLLMENGSSIISSGVNALSNLGNFGLKIFGNKKK